MVASPAQSGKPGTSRALDPLDLYDVRGLLTEDEQLVQDSVARFVDESVLPVIQKHFEEHSFPRELIPEIAELGLARQLARRLRLRGNERGELRPRSARSSSAATPGSAASSRCSRASACTRSTPSAARSSASKYLPADGEGRADRLLRPHRAARRLRSGQHEDAREAPRRRLGAQRREDVDHERAHRGPRDRLGAAPRTASAASSSSAA